MSLVIFLFGVTLLYLVYLALTLVPSGTDPRAAGEALAKDPRAGFAVDILAGLFLAGLALASSRFAYFVYIRIAELKHPSREHEPPAPRFSRCPVCTVNIPFGSLGRNFRNHLKREHHDYWRWKRNWSIAIIVALMAWMVLLFPLLIFGIIPGARTGATSATFYIIGGYIFVEVLVLILGGWSSRAGTRRFRQEWQQQHPLHLRTYGNLKGARAKVKFNIGRTAAFKDPFLPLELLHPASLLVVPVIFLLGRFTLRRVTLDKFEDSRLWLYDAFDTLISFNVKSLSPSELGSEKVVLVLEKGSLEIRTENSADLENIRSVVRGQSFNPQHDSNHAW